MKPNKSRSGWFYFAAAIMATPMAITSTLMWTGYNQKPPSSDPLPLVDCGPVTARGMPIPAVTSFGIAPPISMGEVCSDTPGVASVWDSSSFLERFPVLFLYRRCSPSAALRMGTAVAMPSYESVHRAIGDFVPAATAKHNSLNLCLSNLPT